jgi:hypothetical protein
MEAWKKRAAVPLLSAGCSLASTNKDINGPDRRAVDSVVTNEVLAGLRAQAAPGCLLCSIDEWEADWNAQSQE